MSNIETIELTLSGSKASAASKKSNLLKKAREGKITRKLLLITRNVDTELSKVLTVEECEAALRGEMPRGKNSVTINPDNFDDDGNPLPEPEGSVFDAPEDLEVEDEGEEWNDEDDRTK